MHLNGLLLLHVLFRHGDRTPDLVEMYPNDPFHNISYFPEGLGQLTKMGKDKEFGIGKALRKRYDQFLGSYKSDEVSAISTDYIRTKMSCLLVLAGLYPPKDNEVWNEGLLWQPIPYSYTPITHDHLLGDPYYDCPRQRQLYDGFLSSSQGNAILEKRKNLYEYLSMHTGLNVTTTRDVYNLFFVLKTEQDMGLKLPEWTKSVWPDNITEAATDEYYANLATPKLQRLAGGKLVEKILKDTNSKISNKLDATKIYLYSAHENNVAYQLIYLKVFHHHVPPCGSYIVFEVHVINGVYGVKILYEDYSKPEPSYLKIPGCDVFCPLDKFSKLMQGYVPFPEDNCDD